uniref:Gelsolin n=1 Tax=Macaca fascicularis TaxID=9541 RepID=A0A2K5WSN2_MACFA
PALAGQELLGTGIRLTRRRGRLPSKQPLTSSPRWTTPSRPRSRSFPRAVRPHCSSSSSRTGGTQTRQMAWACPTFPAISPTWSGCPSTPPPCTPPLPWPPNTAWMMMAQARNRSGELKAPAKYPWTLPHMDSSMEETATSFCTTTAMEAARGR